MCSKGRSIDLQCDVARNRGGMHSDPAGTRPCSANRLRPTSGAPGKKTGCAAAAWGGALRAVAVRLAEQLGGRPSALVCSRGSGGALGALPLR